LHHLGRIEHAQTHAGGEQALHRLIENGFRNDSLLNGGEKRIPLLMYALLHRNAADQIGSSLECNGHACDHGFCVMVVLKDVGNRRAIGDHVALEAPILAEVFAQQDVIRARRLSVDRVVGAHQGTGLTLGHRRPKRGQIRVLQVVTRDFDIAVAG
jgi:hypothetical protein